MKGEDALEHEPLGVRPRAVEEDAVATGCAVRQVHMRPQPRIVAALWDKMKLQSQPSAADALHWFESLPLDSSLSEGERSAARKVLTFYPENVWNEQVRWLNLQGKVIRKADFRFGCLDPRAFPGLFAGIRSQTADFSMLTRKVRVLGLIGLNR
jgi:hypothetical protein